MTEPQPEYVWAYSDEKPRRGRVWLIIGLSVAAIAIAAAVFGLFFRPGAPGAEPSATPSSSATASATPTATATVTPTPTPSSSPTPTSSPEPEPTQAPPAPSDPGVAVFREKVTPTLDAAATGLGYARDESSEAAMQDIMLLQDDAERLNETVPPASIAARWRDALSTYAKSLEALRAAYESGGDASREDAAASDALSGLRATISG